LQDFEDSIFAYDAQPPVIKIHHLKLGEKAIDDKIQDKV